MFLIVLYILSIFFAFSGAVSGLQYLVIGQTLDQTAALFLTISSGLLFVAQVWLLFRNKNWVGDTSCYINIFFITASLFLSIQYGLPMLASLISIQAPVLLIAFIFAVGGLIVSFKKN